MVNVEIDGKLVEAEQGSTVIEAAHKAGVQIPHFCYHKKLSLAANCRMCLVEVEKAPKPLPACVTPVADGMKVLTHSESAVKAQRGVMEFLLINHPLDCPICDQGGECQLQDLAVGYGGSASRYSEEKRIVKHKEVGELISTKEMSRCIHCTRCVRFGEEVAGIRELGMTNRTEHAEILTFVNSSVDSELSGNMIDLCPVGALTSKPFRYVARNWELSRRRSVSPHDSLGSPLAIHVKNSKVLRVTPIENEEVNECWISDRDRFSYEGLNSEQRLTRPMIKQGGSWQEVDWKEALEYIANGVKQIVNNSSAEQIAALTTPSATLEELFLLQKLIKGMGSFNVDHRLRQTDFSMDAQLQDVSWLGMPIAEVAQHDRVLLIGSFLRKDHPLLSQRIRQATKHGTQLNLIHVADDNLLMTVANRAIVKPGAMLDMVAQVAKAVAIDAKLSDEQQLALQHVEISAEAQSIADSLRSGEKSTVLLGNYAVQHPNFAQIQLQAQLISQLTGASFGILTEAANSVGAQLVGATPVDMMGKGMNAQQMIDQPRKVYFLLNVEAELDMANPDKTVKALKQADMVVAMSPFKHGATDYADVLLPIAPFTETSGTFISCEGRVQSFKGAVKPLAETRPAWKVLRVLANMLNLPGFKYESTEQIKEDALALKNIKSALSNELKGVPFAQVEVESAAGLQRVSDVPIYFADGIVRRATALQKTTDAQAPTLQMNAAMLSQYGLSDGQAATVTQDDNSVVLNAKLTDSLPDGVVRIAAAHASTAALGAMYGVVTVTPYATAQSGQENEKALEQA